MHKPHAIKLSTSFNLLIAASFVTSALAMILIVNHQQRKQALIEAEAKALIILDRNLATHRYFTDELKPHVFAMTAANRQRDFFDPAWMSSTYAVRKIDTLFKANGQNDYYYKECAINARNPQNEADDYERAFIVALRSNPLITTRSGVRTIAGKPYFFVMKQGERMENSCLRCHSIPDAAPASLVSLYGDKRSFHRKEGELASAISIRIPLNSAFAEANRFSLQLSAMLLALLALIAGLQAWLGKRLVLAPIAAIRAKAKQIASDEAHLGDKISIASGREFMEMAEAFNSMSRNLRLSRDNLEERVRQRTFELEELNRQLCHEIEERKLAEERIQSLNVELEERVKARTIDLENANHELETFNYSASHDLRAPLMRIEAFCKILQEEYGDRLDEAGNNYLERLQYTGRQMEQTIKGMKALSTVTHREVCREKVDLSTIAEGILDSLRCMQPARKARLNVQPGVVVLADDKLIRIALDNLLGNAWKFTGGTAETHIDFGVLQREGEQVFFVRDNGAGFDMEYAEVLFKPFERLHSAAEFPGSGIGLAIVRKIIHRHGGSIWAESAPGNGTTFYFTL